MSGKRAAMELQHRRPLRERRRRASRSARPLVCGDAPADLRASSTSAPTASPTRCAARGVGAGDHVGLYLYNGHEFLEAMLAAFKLRAVPININYRYVEDELALPLHERRPASRSSTARARRRASPRCATASRRSGRSSSSRTAAPAATTPARSSTRRCSPRPRPSARFGPRSGDDLYIIYTGGTTGMPRGVMWRHEDVFFAGLQGGNPGGEPHRAAGGARAARRAASEEPLDVPARRAVHPRRRAVGGAASAGSAAARSCSRPGRSFDAAARRASSSQRRAGEHPDRSWATRWRARWPRRSTAQRDVRHVARSIVIASAGAILSDAVKDAARRSACRTR